ncbi:MAG: S8 family serine peptidase [Candidatus Riflebacteria bacterium]|nr:S8 family serine peptidase [Candidatus Riflebacteria bacterium]
MKRLALLGFVFCLLAGCALAGGVIDRAVQTQVDEAGPGDTLSVIVLFKDPPVSQMRKMSVLGAGAREELEETMRASAKESQKDFENGLMAHEGVKDVRHFWLVNALSCRASADAIEKLASRDDVRAIVPNATIQLEPTLPGYQPRDEVVRPTSGLTYTYGLQKLKIPELRKLYNLDGQGIVVGHIDTGVDFEHPDLKGKMVGWKDFVASKPQPYDDQGHGTHTAGTIAGGQTSGLAIGVAPGAKLLVAKAFSSSGSAQTDWLLGAMQFMADPDGNPATNDFPLLVSNSWGGGPGQTTFLEATKNWLRLGIFPCFAAGNSGPGAATVGTPGGFLESFAVGATTDQDTIADFSSRGPVTWDGKKFVKPDVSAPGQDVTSAKNGGGYRTISGTSMACPHVAGLIALMLQAAPGTTIDQMRDLLEKTSDELGEPGKDNVFGAGRVNAVSAAQIAVSGGKVVGKLTDAATGAGIKGTVKVQENGFAIPTGADGSFLFVLPAGKYTLSGTSFGFESSAGFAVELTAHQETPVAIALKRAASGTLAGKVVSGATGETLAAKVAVLDTPLEAVATDANGAFSLAVPGGQYKLFVTAFGYEPFTSDLLTVGSGNTQQVEVKLQKLPPILVVDDDDNGSCETFYKAVLTELGQRFSLVAADALGADAAQTLAQYSVVIWFTGESYRGTLSETDQQALIAFLTSGGRLMLTGQDIAYEVGKTALFKDLIKVKFENDTAGTKQIGGAFTFKIEGGDGANNQRYPDKVSALTGTDAYLKYAATSGDGGVAGVKTLLEKGRVLFLAFGFEGIDTAANRKAVMADAIKFLLPTQMERVSRIALMPIGLRAAYEDLMAREASELPANDAARLSDQLRGQDSRVFGKVQKILGARALDHE